MHSKIFASLPAAACLMFLTLIGCTASNQSAIEGETPEESRLLGIGMQNVDETAAAAVGLKKASGVWVTYVLKGSPAELGRLKRYDVILKIGNRTVSDGSDVSTIVRKLTNKTVDVEGIRGKSPFTLPVTLRSDLKSQEMSVGTYEKTLAGDKAVAEGRSREALDHYVSALNEHAGKENDRLREKIINVVLKLTVQPAVPEEARKALAIAKATQVDSKNENDDYKAIRQYIDASFLAPWLPEIYFNLGILAEKNTFYDLSARSYRLYLLAAPDAEDAEGIKDRIYVLEDKQKTKDAEAKTVVVKAAKEEESLWISLISFPIVVGLIAYLVIQVESE